MSSSNSDISLKDLEKIQSTILKVCKANKGFKEKFSKEGLIYTLAGEYSEVTDDYEQIDPSDDEYDDFLLVKEWLDKNRFTRNDDKGCWEKLIGGVPLVYGDYSFYTDGDGTIIDMDGNTLVDEKRGIMIFVMKRHVPITFLI